MKRNTTLCVWFAAAVCTAVMACGSDDETPPVYGQAGSGGSATGGTAGDAGVGANAGSGGGSGATGGSGGSGGTGTGGTGGRPPPVDCPDIGLDPGAGAIFYACDCGTDADPDCQPGDDSNAGTAPDAPWRTYQKAREGFGNLSPGDSVVFCQGGAFDVDASGGSRWVNDQCQASNPCVVRDYPAPWASGDEARPILRATGDARMFALEDAADADHEEGYTFLNLDLRGGGDGQGFFIYNDMDDVLICNVSIDNFSLGVHAGGSNTPSPGSDGLNERIVLRNSQITNNKGQGWLGGCNECAVEYSRFENNGFERAMLNHNIYFSGSSGQTSMNMRAIGNDLYRSAVINGECTGVSFVVHGHHDGLLIEGNLVREDVSASSNGCWGIAVDTGYSEGELFRNVTIRGNTVVNVGNVAIGLNACENCLVENNVVIHDQPFGITGIAVPDRDRDPNDLPMTGVTVRNNSVYIGADSQGRAIRLGGEGTGHKVVSNAIHYAGTSGGFSCFDLDLAASAYDVVDHNLCFYPNAGGGDWVSGAGDLAAWQASSSFDQNSLVADPGFASTTSPGYDLAPSGATSPLVEAGHPSESAPNDITGKTRDTTPDIGAYEW